MSQYLFCSKINIDKGDEFFEEFTPSLLCHRLKKIDTLNILYILFVLVSLLQLYKPIIRITETAVKFRKYKINYQTMKLLKSFGGKYLFTSILMALYNACQWYSVHFLLTLRGNISK